MKNKKDKELLNKIKEFVEIVDNCKVIRTPWFIIWIRFRSE